MIWRQIRTTRSESSVLSGSLDRLCPLWRKNVAPHLQRAKDLRLYAHWLALISCLKPFSLLCPPSLQFVVPKWIVISLVVKPVHWRSARPAMAKQQPHAALKRPQDQNKPSVVQSIFEYNDLVMEAVNIVNITVSFRSDIDPVDLNSLGDSHGTSFSSQRSALSHSTLLPIQGTSFPTSKRPSLVHALASTNQH